VNNHQRVKRDTVQGWSESSTRRNTRFLYSVDERKLTGTGFALSLTVRDCPTTPDDWKRVREAFFVRMRRMGMVRAHWLTEWQRRGVPHMHVAIWFEGEPPTAADVRKNWVAVAGKWGAKSTGQHVAEMTNAVGWFQYLSKHAVRGLSHYQRSSDSIPPGWKITGRMWGHLGEWPTVDPVRYTVTNECFWAYRRVVQRWRYADARESADKRRIRSARTMLRSSDRDAGACRGVGEWVGQDLTQQVLRYLAAIGHEIRC
jgi:hypothetical protein